ncbi:LysR substrate-binding domain-containing protein [Gammaproteobacteria bacterium]|nr:LysR substrate-binding domain-containing protein [Gammaproteobacteria bacterium]
MITLKQMDYALAVAKHLHFKKAAEECFISPSTLSNAITEMEKELGFQIFERNNKKVIVTNLGIEVLEKAQSIRMQMLDIKHLTEKQSEPLSHLISIGIIPTVSPYLLPIMLPKIKKEFPNLLLKIEEGQSHSLLNKVKNGDLDIAILALPYDLNGLISLKFWEEDFYWISHHQNKLAGKTQIRADQLEHSELLLLEDGHCLKDHILDACKISSNSKHILKASSLVTLIQLAKGNMGSTLVPKMALNQLLASHKDLSKSHLDEPGPHREIALIIRPTYTGIKNAELLQSLCKDVLTEHHF